MKDCCKELNNLVLLKKIREIFKKIVPDCYDGIYECKICNNVILLYLKKVN